MDVKRSKHAAQTLMGEFHARTIHYSLLFALLNVLLTWLGAALITYLQHRAGLITDCSLSCIKGVEDCCQYSGSLFYLLMTFGILCILVTRFTTKLVAKEKLKHSGLVTFLLIFSFFVFWHFTGFAFGEFILLSIVAFFAVFAGYRLSF